MTSTQPLNEQGYVTLDSDGNGTLQMKPHGGGEIWLPVVASVSASSNTNEASCKVYAGPSPTDPYFVDGTTIGSTGDSTDRIAGYQIDTHGTALWAVWQGGDAGAQATMQINGTEQIP